MDEFSAANATLEHPISILKNYKDYYKIGSVELNSYKNCDGKSIVMEEYVEIHSKELADNTDFRLTLQSIPTQTPNIFFN